MSKLSVERKELDLRIVLETSRDEYLAFDFKLNTSEILRLSCVRHASGAYHPKPLVFRFLLLVTTF